MDGDAAPLREIVALKEKYGAWLMVDEAHATGLYGKNGRGLADELGVSGQIEIQMGTLGKALGASGGYICGSRALIDFLVNRARSFIFSTAPVPAAAAAATAGIQFVQSAEGEARRESLWQRVAELLNSKFEIRNSKFRSAIIPLIHRRRNQGRRSRRAIARARHFHPRHPLSDRGARRGALARDADRRALARDDVAQLVRALDDLKFALQI